MPADSRLVYSTDAGRICPGCRQPMAQCTCGAPVRSGTPDGVVKVSREKQGRGGKTVTVVRGLGLSGDELTTLAKGLKAACGSGGTAKDGVVEIQGDHVEKVIACLQQRGRTVKRAGG
ncbi:MAG: translation initiation factor 1 [Pseudomonadota bacterium]|nr:translation initiation factor 1 [Pseudomonadota bacterium]